MDLNTTSTKNVERGVERGVETAGVVMVHMDAVSLVRTSLHTDMLVRRQLSTVPSNADWMMTTVNDLPVCSVLDPPVVVSLVEPLPSFLHGLSEDKWFVRMASPHAWVLEPTYPAFPRRSTLIRLARKLQHVKTLHRTWADFQWVREAATCEKVTGKGLGRGLGRGSERGSERGERIPLVQSTKRSNSLVLWYGCFTETPQVPICAVQVVRQFMASHLLDVTHMAHIATVDELITYLMNESTWSPVHYRISDDHLDPVGHGSFGRLYRSNLLEHQITDLKQVFATPRMGCETNHSDGTSSGI